MATLVAQNPRYEAHENPPVLASLGYGFQFSLLASASLLVTPVIVAQASGRGDSYLTWMVFASLIAVGLSTLVQVRRLGPVGAGAVLPMFTAAFSIPFCITAVVDGGPATLTTLVLVSGVLQIVISKWLFILRRLVTPTVGGTVMMILSITLASVVFGLLDAASEVEPVSAPLTAPGYVDCSGHPHFSWDRGAAPVGAYDWHCHRLRRRCRLRRLRGRKGITGPLGGTSQRVAPVWRWTSAYPSGPSFRPSCSSASSSPSKPTARPLPSRGSPGAKARAIDFRQVQGTLAGTGVSNLIAGVAGAVPTIIHPGAVAFTQVTGIASRRVGYCIGCMFIVVAFLPKVSGLLSTIPGPVMTGYLIMVTGTLFVDGARTVIQSEQNRQKVLVAGVSFWIGAAFQFGLVNLPNVGPILGTLLKSGVTTGGFAAIAMILFLEFTSHRPMRFQSQLHIEALEDLNAFIARFADRRGWDTAMKDRLSAVAEETLLTLAPLDLEGEGEDEQRDGRRLVVLASSDGPVADLEFIGGGNDENLEDRIRQLQQHDTETPAENELSLLLLRSYASSVRHQQYQDTDVITVRVTPPAS